MQLSVMTTAQRDGEFVADLHAYRPWLRKPQMMWVARLPAADEAWLGSDELQMCLVTKPLGFGNGKSAFVDPSGEQSGGGGPRGAEAGLSRDPRFLAIDR